MGRKQKRFLDEKSNLELLNSFVGGMSLSEIAKKLNVSRECIRQKVVRMAKEARYENGGENFDWRDRKLSTDWIRQNAEGLFRKYL